MISLLRWIWGAVKAILKRLLTLLGVLWDILHHAIVWVLAGLFYLLHQLAEWINDIINSGISSLLNTAPIQGTFLENVPSLAQYVLHDWIAMDYAVELLLSFLLIWIAAKVMRVALIPIRAVLDLL